MKRQIIELKEQLSKAKNTNNRGSEGGQAAAANNEDNDLGAARAMAANARQRAGRGPAAGGGRAAPTDELEAMASIQMALQMRDYEARINER